MYFYYYYYCNCYYCGYCVLASLCFIIYVQLLLGVLIAGSFVQLGWATLLVTLLISVAHTLLLRLFSLLFSVPPSSIFYLLSLLEFYQIYL